MKKFIEWYELKENLDQQGTFNQPQAPQAPQASQASQAPQSAFNSKQPGATISTLMAAKICQVRPKRVAGWAMNGYFQEDQNGNIDLDSFVKFLHGAVDFSKLQQ